MAKISQTGKWVVMLAIIGAAILVASIVGTILFNQTGRPVGEYDGEWTPGDPKFDVVIRPHGNAATVDAGTVDGHPVSVRCDTCHSGREPNRKTNSGDDLRDFHVGLEFNHGGGALGCMACHNSEDYETLRKPDGTIVPFASAMELCAQCHGPQYRDYLGGSHGGMTGYWDLQRGGRVRNGCLDCHDVHSPAFKKMLPLPPPKVRAGTQSAGGGH